MAMRIRTGRRGKPGAHAVRAEGGSSKRGEAHTAGPPGSGGGLSTVTEGRTGLHVQERPAVRHGSHRPGPATGAPRAVQEGSDGALSGGSDGEMRLAQGPDSGAAAHGAAGSEVATVTVWVRTHEVTPRAKTAGVGRRRLTGSPRDRARGSSPPGFCLGTEACLLQELCGMPAGPQEHLRGHTRCV